MSLAGSTSSSATGWRPVSAAILILNRPRMVCARATSRFTSFEYSPNVSNEPLRTACCNVETVSDDQTWLSPRSRSAYSPPNSSALVSTGSLPNALVWRRTVSSAISSRPTPSIIVAVPVKYLSTKALDRPTASKICAPQ